jgi:hypothetical protein
MDEIELQDFLKTYNQKLEEAKVLNLQSWVLNLQCFEALQKQKAKSKLRSLMNFKIIAVILGILWILFLGYLLFYLMEMQKIFFVISVAAIILFTLTAIIMYVHHIILIHKINNTESVLEAQEKLAHLKLSTLNITRFLFLQTPFYCTFWWSFNFIENSPKPFWFISFPIALLFAFASIWLFKNISIKNIHKKWFKILFNSAEWTSLIKANNFLREIESFKKEKW